MKLDIQTGTAFVVVILFLFVIGAQIMLKATGPLMVLFGLFMCMAGVVIIWALVETRNQRPRP